MYIYVYFEKTFINVNSCKRKTHVNLASHNKRLFLTHFRNKFTFSADNLKYYKT